MLCVFIVCLLDVLPACMCMCVSVHVSMCVYLSESDRLTSKKKRPVMNSSLTDLSSQHFAFPPRCLPRLAAGTASQTTSFCVRNKQASKAYGGESCNNEHVRKSQRGKPGPLHLRQEPRCLRHVCLGLARTIYIWCVYG